MRVMCVRKCNQYSGDKPYWYSPEVGDKLKVIGVIEVYNIVFYDLEGYPEFLYNADYFAVLPDSSADEMSEVEREAIVNLETVLV